MSAAARRFPAKGLKLGFQISQIANVLYPGIGLDLIMIHNDRERLEAVVGSADEGFPNLSFLQLPVARENENAATVVPAGGGPSTCLLPWRYPCRAVPC